MESISIAGDQSSMMSFFGLGSEQAADNADGSASEVTLSRAELSQILYMEQAHVNASGVRTDSARLRIAQKELRTQFRERGRRLVAQGKQGALNVRAAIEEKRDQASQTASSTRSRSRMLRAQKEHDTRAWEDKTILAAAAAAELHNRKQQEERERKDCVMIDAMASSTELKALTKQVRERIERENDERAESVRNQSSMAHVVRPAKQLFANQRFVQAEAVRLEGIELRKRRDLNTVEYLANAIETRAATKWSQEEAKARRKAEREAEAAAMRESERRQRERIEASKREELSRRRAICSTVRAGKRVPASLVEEHLRAGRQQHAKLQVDATIASTAGLMADLLAGTPGQGAASSHAGSQEESAAPDATNPPIDNESTAEQEHEPFMSLARYFGFRRRGAGQSLTSSASGSRKKPHLPLPAASTKALADRTDDAVAELPQRDAVEELPQRDAPEEPRPEN